MACGIVVVMATAAGVPGIEVDEVGDLPLVDVREDDEWAAGHAPGALHVPLSELAGRSGDVPRDRRVAVICHAGGRSAQAVGWLNAQGWDTVNVSGGMLAWERAGKPLSGPGGHPTVD